MNLYWLISLFRSPHLLKAMKGKPNCDVYGAIGLDCEVSTTMHEPEAMRHDSFLHYNAGDRPGTASSSMQHTTTTTRSRFRHRSTLKPSNGVNLVSLVSVGWPVDDLSGLPREELPPWENFTYALQNQNKQKIFTMKIRWVKYSHVAWWGAMSRTMRRQWKTMTTEITMWKAENNLCYNKYLHTAF